MDCKLEARNNTATLAGYFFVIFLLPYSPAAVYWVKIMQTADLDTPTNIAEAMKIKHNTIL